MLKTKVGFLLRAKRLVQRIIRWDDRRSLQTLKRRVDMFKGRRQGAHALRTLMIDIMYKCTLTCVTCRCPDIDKSLFKDLGPLTLAELGILFHDFKKFGGTAVSISGGEPFIHPEIGSILAMAKGMGFKVAVTSNHTAMTEKKALLVADYVDDLCFSLDGPTPEVNDTIRGKGAFQKAIEGRKTLQRVLAERNREWVANYILCTISRLNYKFMPQMVEFIPTIGVKNISFNYLSIVPDAVDEKTEQITDLVRSPEESHWRLDHSLLIPPDQVEECCKYAVEAKACGNKMGVTVKCDHAFDGKHNNSIVTGKFELSKPGTCSSFFNKVGVRPDGSFFLCEMLQHYPIANIRDSKLEDVLSHPGRVRLQKMMYEDGWLPICYYCCSHKTLV